MSSFFSRLVVFAQDAADGAAEAADAAGAPAAEDGGFFSSPYSWLPLLAILALLFYFVVIRPEKQKEAAAEKRKSSIKKNDHVETIGGIFGVVTNVTEKHITVRVDENSNAKIKLRRSAIARIVGEDEEADDTDSSK